MIYQKNQSINSRKILLKYFLCVSFFRLHEGYLNENNDSTSDEDSVESTKTGEQATTD